MKDRLSILYIGVPWGLLSDGSLSSQSAFLIVYDAKGTGAASVLLAQDLSQQWQDLPGGGNPLKNLSDNLFLMTNYVGGS